MPVNHEELRRRIAEEPITRVAERAGIPRSHLSLLANGRAKDVHLSTLDRIAHALNCRARDLID